MKVTCQSCQAKYTIADEKVRGKIAKIRCKKCGTTIVVNGTGSSADSGAAPQTGTPREMAESWMVLFGDDDQRTLTAEQVVGLHAQGAIDSETLVWRDGMPDWLPISQVPELWRLVEPAALTSVAPDAASSAEPIVPEVSAASPDHRPAPELRAPSRAPGPEPLTARRRARGPSADLFGASAHEEVMPSGSPGGAILSPPGLGHDKPTGARNENSVLFSLASLTGDPGLGGGPKPRAPGDQDRGSARADLRALMAGGEARPGPNKSKLDDIMHLGGGGLYSPAMLTAPVLAPPPIEVSAAEGSRGASSRRGRGWLAIAGAVVVLGAGAAIAFNSMNEKAELSPIAGAASASPIGSTEAMQAAAAEPAKAAPEPSAAEPAASSAPVAVAVAPGQVMPKTEPEQRKVISTRVEKPREREDKPAPTASPAAPNPAALGVPPPAPAAAAAAPAGGSGEFDRAAALSALSAAATSAQTCKKPDGPTGSGRIAITFANNGLATTATVEGPPFAGTPVGGCVAARFRSTRVPPFGGAPMTVHKTFNIN